MACVNITLPAFKRLEAKFGFTVAEALSKQMGDIPTIEKAFKYIRDIKTNKTKDVMEYLESGPIYNEDILRNKLKGVIHKYKGYTIITTGLPETTLLNAEALTKMSDKVLSIKYPVLFANLKILNKIIEKYPDLLSYKPSKENTSFIVNINPKYLNSLQEEINEYSDLTENVDIEDDIEFYEEESIDYEANREYFEYDEPFAFVEGLKKTTPIKPEVDELFSKDLAQKIQDILQKLYPEIKLNITNNPIWEQGDNIFNQEEYNNQVNYRLKATEKILDNLTKIKQWENNKSIDTNTLWKKIGELGISKQQLDLLKESRGSTVEEKLTSFVANYSYTIEINTAKEGGTVGKNQGLAINEARNQGLIYGSQEFNDFVKNYVENKGEKYIEKPTQYYSNLTVPGGTNYTENEIAIPGKLVEEKPQGVEVKSGVPELFESNPELANAVYEALGVEIKNFKLIPNDEKHPEDANTYDVIYKNEKIGVVALFEGKNKVIKGVKLDEKFRNKGLGKKLYKFLNLQANLQGGVLFSDPEQQSADARRLWESLIKEGVVNRATADEQSLKFNIDYKQQALQLYSQYLDTIFPDSKVKDIVYHGSKEKFDKFDKNITYKNISNKIFNEYIQGFYFSEKGEYGKEYPVLLNSKNVKDLTELFKASNRDIDYQVKQDFNRIQKAIGNNEIDTALIERPLNLKLKPVGTYVVNIKQGSTYSVYFTNDGMATMANEVAKNVKEEDLAFYKKLNEENKKYNDSLTKTYNWYVVFEPEQIHILSSKKDLEMFRNFINFTKSEYAKYGDIQQFRDYIMSKNFAAIEEFLVVNNKIDREC